MQNNQNTQIIQSNQEDQPTWTNYSGSILEFDLSSTTSSLQYYQDFQRQLQELGWKVEQIKGRGNRLQVSYQGQLAFLYFQGAGAVHWWAFQKSVAADLLQKANGHPVYLVAGGRFGERTQYFIKEATAEEYPQGVSGREMISGDAPKGFQSVEKWEGLMIWRR